MGSIRLAGIARLGWEMAPAREAETRVGGADREKREGKGGLSGIIV